MGFVLGPCSVLYTAGNLPRTLKCPAFRRSQNVGVDGSGWVSHGKDARGDVGGDTLGRGDGF